MISSILPSPSLPRDSSLDAALTAVLSSLTPPWSNVEILHDPSQHTPETSEDPDPFYTFYAHASVQAPHPKGTARAHIIVTTEPWTRPYTIAFFNRFSDLLLIPYTTDDEDPPEDPSERINNLFHFCSAYPIPPMIDYIFARNWTPGRLEAALLPSFRISDFLPETCETFARESSALFAHAFDIDIDLQSTETLNTLNTLLLETIRPSDRPELALPANTHRPVGLLTQLGAILGTLFCSLHPESIRWVTPPEDIDSEFPILEVPAPDTGDGSNPGSSYIFPFDKIFQVYQNGNDRNLLTYYNVIVANSLERNPSSTPHAESFEDASPNLLPVLKTPGWHTQHNLIGCELYPNGPTGNPSVTLALDSPDQIAFVSQNRTEAWNMDEAELIAHACANLARITPNPKEHFETIDIEGVTVYRLEYNDYFNASRIMLQELLFEHLQALEPDAPVFVVAVPNRDYLVASPARPDAPDHSHTFLHLVQWLHERQPAPISSVCFLLGAEGLIGYYNVCQDA